jgi:hypothetical protein
MHKNTAWRTSLRGRNGICQTANDAPWVVMRLIGPERARSLGDLPGGPPGHA